MASQNPRSSDARQDAVTILKHDHRTVEDLFSQFEEAEEGEHLGLAERICQLLTVHARIEEEILYPAAKDALSDDEEDSALVYEAEVEHSTAKDLIAKIEGTSEPDEAYKATVKVLSEYIKHHVKEEEGELFPALRKSELDLKDIGAQLSQRKIELMEEMGIEEEESDESQSRPKRVGRSKARRTGTRSSTRAGRH